MDGFLLVLLHLWDSSDLRNPNINKINSKEKILEVISVLYMAGYFKNELQIYEKQVLKARKMKQNISWKEIQIEYNLFDSQTHH